MSESNLYYQIIAGGEEKLVFLHGLLGNSMNWRSVTSHFSDYTVLVLDQRGHGRSHHPKSGYLPEDYSEDLKKLLDQLGWEQAHFIGHSMGARNLLVFSSLYPERCKSVILEDLGPEILTNKNWGEFVNFQEYLINLVPVPFVSRKEAKSFFEVELLEKLSGVPRAKDLTLFLYSNIVEKENGFSWRFSLEGVLETIHRGRERNYWSEWKRLKVPTLVIRGEDSDYLPREIFDKMKQENTQACFVEIKGAGHWVHFDKKVEFVKVIKDFLNGKLESE